MIASSVRMKLENTQTMISAAEVITLPVEARPSTTALLGVAGLLVVLLDLREQEHLVVHREPEQDREHQQRHVAHDRRGALEPDQGCAVALLEHERHHAVRRGHRQEVRHGRLQRAAAASGRRAGARGS